MNDLKLAMPLYWLVYHHHNQISVVIEPGASLIHARKRAALARPVLPQSDEPTAGGTATVDCNGLNLG
jgi:hypothetical protein